MTVNPDPLEVWTAAVHANLTTDGEPSEKIAAAAAIIAQHYAPLLAEVERLREAFNDIKQEALTAGSPGCRSSAKAFAHIVRLCIDARATLAKLEKARG